MNDKHHTTQSDADLEDLILDYASPFAQEFYARNQCKVFDGKLFGLLDEDDENSTVNYGAIDELPLSGLIVFMDLIARECFYYLPGNTDSDPEKWLGFTHHKCRLIEIFLQGYELIGFEPVRELDLVYEDDHEEFLTLYSSLHEQENLDEYTMQYYLREHFQLVCDLGMMLLAPDSPFAGEGCMRALRITQFGAWDGSMEIVYDISIYETKIQCIGIFSLFEWMRVFYYLGRTTDDAIQARTAAGYEMIDDGNNGQGFSFEQVIQCLDGLPEPMDTFEHLMGKNNDE